MLIALLFLVLGSSVCYVKGNCSNDFEEGQRSLKSWIKTGSAFNNQPTYGDNPYARNVKTRVNHQGNYWIGTYENRPKPSYPSGGVQSDFPTGTLTSPEFRVTGSDINFLIGGGCDQSKVRVELLIDGSRVKATTGKCHEQMHRVHWPVERYRGRKGRIRLVDNSREGWGHLNFDDFRGDFKCEDNVAERMNLFLERMKAKLRPSMSASLKPFMSELDTLEAEFKALNDKDSRTSKNKPTQRKHGKITTAQVSDVSKGIPKMGFGDKQLKPSRSFFVRAEQPTAKEGATKVSSPSQNSHTNSGTQGGSFLESNEWTRATTIHSQNGLVPKESSINNKSKPTTINTATTKVPSTSRGSSRLAATTSGSKEHHHSTSSSTSKTDSFSISVENVSSPPTLKGNIENKIPTTNSFTVSVQDVSVPSKESKISSSLSTKISTEQKSSSSSAATIWKGTTGRPTPNDSTEFTQYIDGTIPTSTRTSARPTTARKTELYSGKPSKGHTTNVEDVTIRTSSNEKLITPTTSSRSDSFAPSTNGMTKSTKTTRKIKQSSHKPSISSTTSMEDISIQTSNGNLISPTTSSSSDDSTPISATTWKSPKTTRRIKSSSQKPSRNSTAGMEFISIQTASNGNFISPTTSSSSGDSTPTSATTWKSPKTTRRIKSSSQKPSRSSTAGMEDISIQTASNGNLISPTTTSSSDDSTPTSASIETSTTLTASSSSKPSKSHTTSMEDISFDTSSTPTSTTPKTVMSSSLKPSKSHTTRMGDVSVSTKSIGRSSTSISIPTKKDSLMSTTARTSGQLFHPKSTSGKMTHGIKTPSAAIHINGSSTKRSNSSINSIPNNETKSLDDEMKSIARLLFLKNEKNKTANDNKLKELLVKEVQKIRDANHSGKPDSVNFKKVGCYADKQSPPRPLKDLLFDDKNKIDRDFQSVIYRCAEETQKRTFKVFGLQLYGQCWSDKDGEKTYNLDKPSNNCYNDKLQPCKDSDDECIGGPDTNFIYRLIDDSKEKANDVAVGAPISTLHVKPGTTININIKNTAGPFSAKVHDNHTVVRDFRNLECKDFLVGLRLPMKWDDILNYPSTVQYGNTKQNIELQVLNLYGEDNEYMGQQFHRFTPLKKNHETQADLVLKFNKRGKFLGKLLDFLGAQNVSAAGCYESTSSLSCPVPCPVTCAPSCLPTCCSPPQYTAPQEYQTPYIPQYPYYQQPTQAMMYPGQFSPPRWKPAQSNYQSIRPYENPNAWTVPEQAVPNPNIYLPTCPPKCVDKCSIDCPQHCCLSMLKKK